MMVEWFFSPATWLMNRLSFERKMTILVLFVVVMLLGVVYASAEKCHSTTVREAVFFLLLGWLYFFGGYYIHARRSIRALTSMTERVGKGDLNVRAETYGDDELSCIGTAMNSMVASLNDKHALLNEYKNAVDKSTLVVKMDRKGKITYVNKAYCRLSGYSLVYLMGKSYHLLYASEPSTKPMEEFWETISDKKIHRGVFEQRGKESESFFVESTTVPIVDADGVINEFISIMHDITALKKHEHELKLQIYRDPLTGLPNRNALYDAIALAKDSKLMLLNIDRFSTINTIYGEQIGNRLLVELGGFLQKLITNEHLQLFKLSSDEYAILADEFVSESFFAEDVGMMASYLNPFKLTCGEHDITMRVSIGAVISARQGGKRSLMTMADIALKKAKLQPKSYYFYSEAADASLQLENNLLTLERLEYAIRHKRIIAHYQPIFNLHSGKIDKFETLMRLVDEDGKVHYPADFIEIAKGARLYAKLTQQIVELAISRAEKHPGVIITVNISIEDITDTGTSAYILERVSHSSAARQLVFEIVESEEIDHNETVRSFFDALKMQGVKIAIDDFGSGYSNYAYMFDMGVDMLKIDGSLVMNMEEDRNKQRITASIIAMAHELDMKTVVEFVGNEKVFEMVREMGADFVQGMYVGSPAEELYFTPPEAFGQGA